MPFLQALAIFAAGLAAGTINTVVGSGTLITFPTLLAFGYPPVLANVSNNVGLVPGVASGVHGYRAELEGQRRRIIRLGSASACGGLERGLNPAVVEVSRSSPAPATPRTVRRCPVTAH